MKSALVSYRQPHEEIVFELEQRHGSDDVIFEHLLEMSGGKINLTQSSEELLNTNDLMRTNKRVTNKINPEVSYNKPITKIRRTKTEKGRSLSRKIIRNRC
jgi:hypothetical protein